MGAPRQGITDEGSGVRGLWRSFSSSQVGPSRSARDITSKELTAPFFNTWVPIAKYPAVRRVDLDGAWIIKETEQAMSDISCEVDPVPGEVHWQQGLAEDNIHLVKDTLGRLAKGCPDVETGRKPSRTIVSNADSMCRLALDLMEKERLARTAIGSGSVAVEGAGAPEGLADQRARSEEITERTFTETLMCEHKKMGI